MAFLSSATAVHADDDSEEPAPGIDQPIPFVRNTPVPADLDEMVQLGPNGEHDARVGAILAAHPDSNVLICLAGCGGGGPKVVTVRPFQAASAERAHMPGAFGRLQPASSHLGGGESVTTTVADPAGGSGDRHGLGDVICLAGCAGAPGEVVQRSVRLTWIDKGATDDLRAALRNLAERIIAQDAGGGENAARAGAAVRLGWMPDDARRALVDTPLPPVLADLVRSASAVAQRSAR